MAKTKRLSKCDNLIVLEKNNVQDMENIMNKITSYQGLNVSIQPKLPTLYSHTLFIQKYKKIYVVNSKFIKDNFAYPV